MVLSKWYDDNKGLPMLKVLFRDVLGTSKLSTITHTMEIIDYLVEKRHLTPSNFNIISDIITLTRHYGLQELIRSIFPSFPEERKETFTQMFSPHRQRIMKFGMILTPSDVRLIDNLYNIPSMEYTDTWSMISDLEDRTIINDRMGKFIRSLENLNLRLALNALTEGTKSALASKPKLPDTPQVQGSYQMPEMSPSQFNQLLREVSRWWQLHGNVNMLNVILSEFKVIPVVLMEEKHEPRALFKHLEAIGLISKANVDIIIETIVLGGHFSLERVIQKSIPTFPELRKVEIKKFSKYRQNVLNFGKVIDKNDMQTIGFLYDLYMPELKDPWCLIFQLEKDGILTDDLHAKQAFIDKLMKNKMKAEARALNKF
ncbi:uncharacterized protein LOC117100706 [Anneissia japonica]|uniref:uncharacterized protein LOC117100706 n=1 Tax=Anneissia japonica TaxID=1529436 RepID=UPI0014259091|nr:uncharacterized protein LOC117100706 [Anneissia japonica]